MCISRSLATVAAVEMFGTKSTPKPAGRPDSATDQGLALSSSDREPVAVA